MMSRDVKELYKWMLRNDPRFVRQAKVTGTDAIGRVYIQTGWPDEELHKSGAVIILWPSLIKLETFWP